MKSFRNQNQQLMLLAILVGCGFVLSSETASAQTPRGHWIVSTYRMSQSLDRCANSYRFQVFYQDPCGKLKHSNLNQMRSAMNPAAPTCVFVHGSFTDFDFAAVEARYTAQWIRNGRRGAPLNMVFLAWPSDELFGITFAIKVIKNGLLADHNGIYLSNLIDCLPAQSPTCLIGHSHGTRVIASCLHYRNGGIVRECRRPGGCAPRRNLNAIFAAAAVNHEWFNPDDRYGGALFQVDQLVVLINRKDIALTVYPLASPTYRRALSQSGTTFIDQQKLGPNARKIKQLDLTFDIGFGHTWKNYYGNRKLAGKIAPFVFRYPCQSCPHIVNDSEQSEQVESIEVVKGNTKSKQEPIIILPELPERFSEDEETVIQ